MNGEVINKCSLLVKNHEILQDSFKWRNNLMLLAGSSFYAGLNMEADAAKMKECEEILKNYTGKLSAYRGNVRVPILCKMAVSENPEQYIKNIQAIVQQMMEMKKSKWISTDYKILAAMTIADHAKPEEYSAAVVKSEELFEKMKENHPWLTGGEDLPFAAMLAVSGVNTELLLNEMEACYELLKERFHSKDAVQSLSHVLAADPQTTETKCRKVEELFELLKEKKHKFGAGYELAVLGTLCGLDMPIKEVAEEIIEADEYLKTQKGFSGLILGDKNRRMYAAMMVLDTHMPDARGHEAVLDSTLAIIISMEVCMIILMTSMCCTTVAVSG